MVHITWLILISEVHTVEKQIKKKQCRGLPVHSNRLERPSNPLFLFQGSLYFKILRLRFFFVFVFEISGISKNTHGYLITLGQKSLCS